MSESEWATLIDALLRAMPGGVEIEDARHLIIDPVISPEDGRQARSA